MSHDTHETAPTQLVQVGDVQFAYRRFGRRGGVPLLFFNYFAAPTARHRYGPSTSAIPLERETAFPLTRSETITMTQSQNKALVLQAFDTLFNRRDYAAAERFWSPAYIQHSAHIAPGREGLFELVRAAPKELRYENALIVAEGDYVMLHGRFSGIGRPVNWIVADILRVENGLLAEHWDVIQDEATRAASKSGLPMFGDKFPD